MATVAMRGGTFNHGYALEIALASLSLSPLPPICLFFPGTWVPSYGLTASLARARTNCYTLFRGSEKRRADAAFTEIFVRVTNISFEILLPA